MGKKRKGKKRKKPQGRPVPPPEPGQEPAPEVIRGPSRKFPVLPLAIVAAVIGILAFVFLKRGGDYSVSRDAEANVLLVTLDTTRADRLGCYGYEPARTPNLDDLARRGVLFSNAYSPVPMTLPAHSSIMTGLTPPSHGVHNNGTYVLGSGYPTIAEILKDRGFETAAFTASFSVDSRFGLARGFDVYDDSFQEETPFKSANSERRADEVFASFASWLDKNAPDRFFAWVHFFDPHLPYHPPPDLAAEFIDRPYDGEIASMDRALGKIIQALQQKNLLGRTLIVLAGDHGEEFGEKGEVGHGIFLYEPSVRVPLILWAGGRLPAGSTIDSRVRLIDILPTVFDFLDIPVPDTVDGISLIPFIERKQKRSLDCYLETFYPRENHGWAELTGLISGEWKYVHAPRPELYHLGTDPGETANLAATETDTAAGMNKILEGMVREAAGGAAESRSLTAEEEERLRSLGYIQFAGKGEESGPDPKDKLDDMKLFQDAQRYEFEGNYRGAEEVYDRILDLYPEIPSSYINLALSQARLQKFQEATETLEAGVAKIPDSAILLSRLGHTYLVTSRPVDGLETMQKVLTINPDDVDALTACAVILGSWGQRDQSRAYLERGLAVEPENKFLRVNLAGNLAMSGRTPEAIELFKQLAEEYSGEAIFHQNLGIAQGMSGDYEGAILSLKEAIRLEPTPAAYYNLAIAYRETGDIGDAVKALELYLQDPGDAPAGNIRSARAELESLKARLR